MNNKIVKMTCSQILSSTEWIDYIGVLARTINLDLYVYNTDGELQSSSGISPLCQFIKGLQVDELSCPDSCMEMIPKVFSSKADEPVVYKCRAGLSFFGFVLERFGERVCIVGRGGFASYEDLIEFLRVSKTYSLPALPQSAALNFTEEEHMKSAARYVWLAAGSYMISFEERCKTEEKFIRLTSIFDSNTFMTLSSNPELLHRYILDTIEFIFGSASMSLMILDHQRLVYKSSCSTGRHRDIFSEINIEMDDPLIGELYRTKTFLSSESMKIPVPGRLFQKMESFYIFPIFINDKIEKFIGIFDRKMSREDIKIMNAFTDYLRLNFENKNLRDYANRLRKADEQFAYFVDFSNSVTSILNKERLFHALVEKSLHLLNAEQGSLMLLDHDTSEFVVEAKKSSDDTVQESMRLNRENSIAGMVLDNGESLLVNDIEKDPRLRRENRPRYKTKSFISILIRINDKVTGVLNVSDKAKGDIFTEEDLRLLQSFVNNAAIAIERSLLYRQTEELKQLSITDPLTGIYNRRYLNNRLSEEITRYNRYKHPFSFMMLDLDKFKEYNDTFGHISGDRLIKALATIMEKSLRNVDIAARFGGDEFVAIFPQTTKDDAIHITNRLKEKIDMAFHHEKFEMPLTISMGLTTYPDDATSVGELLEKTDQALYLAKKGGGNKVVYL